MSRRLLIPFLAFALLGSAGTAYAIPPQPPDPPDPPQNPAPPAPGSGYSSPATASGYPDLGGCSVYAFASWNRNTNALRVDYTVANSRPFAACRARVTATYSYTYREDDGTATFPHSYDLPTACAATIFGGCPSTVTGALFDANGLEPSVFPAIAKWIRPFAISVSSR